MTTNAVNHVIGHLRRAAHPADGAGPTDAELLGRYVARRDGASFEALVGRHGPMVIGVCRRVLGNEADAEDAFQATFLVLVRKAASLRSRGAVGGWLYGVAHNTALKAKAVNRKRRAKEREAGAAPKPEARVGADELALLDAELARLPEKYRVPIVLCDLGGTTIKAAAAQLGWPPGTVATRLTRGRALLAERLTGRGLTPAVGAAAVPAALRGSTVRAATLFAAGQAAGGGVPAAVVALTEGVLRAMLLTKLKTAAGVLVLAAAACWGAGVLWHTTRAAGRPEPAAGAAPAVKPFAAPGGDNRVTDYQKMADAARWLPPEEEGFLRCLAHQLNAYQVEVIRRKGDVWEATIRVSDGGAEVYSWKAHLSTVFLERDGVLYHADFNPHGNGCAVVAYDLKARKRLWRAELKGVGEVSHSKYFNAVRLEPTVDDAVLAVYGKESAGRYVEVVDRKTGKTVGHKLFPKDG